jgi:sensor histidine kinase regulating citrate/malate metabolism
MQQLVRSMSRSYDQFMESNRIIRTLRHDMDNQLYSLSLLLDRQEYDLASQQLESYRTAVKRTRGHIYTGNHVVDAVICGKEDVLAENGISFSCSGTLPVNLPLDPATLCSLTANLLDNAIHACGKLPTAPRDISFAVGIVQSRLIVRCENSCLPDTKIPDGQQDDLTQEHGWGLQIIRQIASLCGGTAAFTVADQRFQAVINLDLTSEVKSC